MRYPEFILAALAGLLFFLLPKNRNAKLSLPDHISAPALTIVSALPQRYFDWLARMQTWAGYRGTRAFAQLSALKVYTCLLSLASLSFLPVWQSLLLALFVFFAFDAYLFVRANQRREQMRQSLPQALDLMVLCVDAGLGLDATLQRISQERSSIAPALNEELALLGRDILLGMQRERAYQELYARTGVEELRSLGASLNQSAKLGLSIAKILRQQSEFLRTKLSQKAEERAAKLPIYMAFPLWFCVMPALMVIVLAPSLIMFFQQMHFQPGLFK